jgi:hypothetical protein
LSENRFTKALKGQGEKIINAGKKENIKELETAAPEPAIMPEQTIEIKKEMSEQDYNQSGYFDYKVVNVKNSSKKGEKYSVGIQLSKETLQKTYYAQMSTGTDLGNYYEYAIKLFYDINYILKKKGINLFTQELSPEEVIKVLQKIDI